MASQIPPIPSELQLATNIKANELRRAKELFKNRVYKNAAELEAVDDPRKRASTLLGQIEKLDPYLEDDDDLSSMKLYLQQAEMDNSISDSKLSKFEKQLWDKLNMASHRLDISSLHTDLLKEVMYPSSSKRLPDQLEKTTLDDDFEVVEENELELVREKFEKTVFTAHETDATRITEHLQEFFKSEHAKEELRRLREDIDEFGEQLLSGTDAVDEELLEWCIKDLLDDGFLSETQREMLQSYTQSPAAMRELRSTLNMKSVRHWNWRWAENGLPVTARKNHQGKYCMVVEEDPLDLIFLHTIATSWSCKLKDCMSEIASHAQIWKRNEVPPLDELDKREYFLLPPRVTNVKKTPKPSYCTTCHGPPPPPPPGGMSFPLPPPVILPSPPRMNLKKKKKPIRDRTIFVGNGSLNEERHRNYYNNFFLSALPQRDGDEIHVHSTAMTLSLLLKHIATEINVQSALKGPSNVAVDKFNFNAFSTSLPHSTIFAILKFIGASDTWLEFFKRFLEAPLNMGPIIRGTSDRILTRKRGVPIGHGMQLFLDELVLFFLDFAVHQESGMYMYRIHDEFFLIGDKSDDKMRSASLAINNFNVVTGLSIRSDSTANELPIEVAHLLLQPGTWTWSINNTKVEATARHVKKQLANCTTVLSWIRTWNESIGEYCSHAFGPLANVFGKSHLENVTKAYKRIFDIVLDGASLTDYLKTMLTAHIYPSLSDPPFALEPLLYFPNNFGGLGVKNPFTTLAVAHEISEDPKSYMKAYFKDEKNYYEHAKSAFEPLKPDVRERKFRSIFGEKDVNGEIKTVRNYDFDKNIFPPLEEVTKFRERIQYAFTPVPPWPAPVPPFSQPPNLVTTYNLLLGEPEHEIEASKRVISGVKKVSRERDDVPMWWRWGNEAKWILQLYGDEAIERYGGMELWHRESVPLEGLKLCWGEDQDVGDDNSSISEV